MFLETILKVHDLKVKQQDFVLWAGLCGEGKKERERERMHVCVCDRTSVIGGEISLGDAL